MLNQTASAALAAARQNVATWASAFAIARVVGEGHSLVAHEALAAARLMGW